MVGLAVESIVKRFGDVHAVKDVSLTVAPGEFVSLVGPSGCGKTTLMRIVAGLERPDGGCVSIAGRDVTGLRAADRDVAMVFQSYALYPHLTARQNIAVPLVMRRLDAWQRLPWLGLHLRGADRILAGIGEEVARAAELLSIGALLDRRPAQLSGGQRQRVALGRAIVRRPSAFLLDVPLSNLDAGLRVQTRKEILEIHRRVGASTVYVTHDQTEAMTMSDRVAVMMAGEILQVDTPERIYVDPVDLRVAEFVGSPRINTLVASLGAGGAVAVAGMEVGVVAQAQSPRDAILAVRPEDMTVAGDGLPARVEHVEFLGDCALIHARHCDLGAPLILRADGRVRRDAGGRRDPSAHRRRPRAAFRRRWPADPGAGARRACHPRPCLRSPSPR
jgi:multiple sugar transport system ATP-binding protein